MVAAESAMDLLPIVHSHALSLQDQESILSDFSGLAIDACALRLQCSDTNMSDVGKHCNYWNSVMELFLV